MNNTVQVNFFMGPRGLRSTRTILTAKREEIMEAYDKAAAIEEKAKDARILEDIKRIFPEAKDFSDDAGAIWSVEG